MPRLLNNKMLPTMCFQVLHQTEDVETVYLVAAPGERGACITAYVYVYGPDDCTLVQGCKLKRCSFSAVPYRPAVPHKLFTRPREQPSTVATDAVKVSRT